MPRTKFRTVHHKKRRPPTPKSPGPSETVQSSQPVEAEQRNLPSPSPSRISTVSAADPPTQKSQVPSETVQSSQPVEAEQSNRPGPSRISTVSAADPPSGSSSTSSARTTSTLQKKL